MTSALKADIMVIFLTPEPAGEKGPDLIIEI